MLVNPIPFVLCLVITRFGTRCTHTFPRSWQQQRSYSPTVPALCVKPGSNRCAYSLQRVLQRWKGSTALHVPWSSGCNAAQPGAHFSSTWQQARAALSALLYTCVLEKAQKWWWGDGVWNRLTKQSLIVTWKCVSTRKRALQNHAKCSVATATEWFSHHQWAGSPGHSTAAHLQTGHKANSRICTSLHAESISITKDSPQGKPFQQLESAAY